MRRRGTTDDSLELLLDTICNVFGGLIFIAMLLVVLAGATGDSIVRDVGGSSPSDVLRLRTDLDLQESRVVALEEAASDAQSAAASRQPAPDQTSLRAQLGNDISEAEDRLRSARSLLDTLQARDRDLAGKLRDAEAVGRELEAQSQQLRDQISQERQARVATARLPVTRVTQKAPVHFVLQNQRIYEVFTRGAGGVRLNDVDVDGEDMGRLLRVTPKPSGGFAPGPDLSRHPRWRQITATRDREQFFMYLMVYPDSFETFRTIKEAGLRAGYEYEVVIMQPDEEVLLVPATSFTTQ